MALFAEAAPVPTQHNRDAPKMESLAIDLERRSVLDEFQCEVLGAGTLGWYIEPPCWYSSAYGQAR